MRDELTVRLDDAVLGAALVGTVRHDSSRPPGIVSFAFAPDWIDSPAIPVLDPSLPYFEGEQYLDGLPRILDDTAPDRWGQKLLERREATLARQQERRPRRLQPWDYLVAVSDLLRMGALRLFSEESASYVGSDDRPVPPVARLRTLQYYAERAERGERLSAKEEEEEMALLIAPGSSLGGARPKANFVDGHGLWIAKFPSHNDRRDMGAWELVLNRLAGTAGIEVPESKLYRLGDTFHTFAARRFDRVEGGRRLFASAMTLLGTQDHADASYLEIAQAITDYGSRARQEMEQDLEQLFRRVVFNVMTAHRDDHLRNHGFLATANGWRLSPAYDLNPQPDMPEHVLAIDESGHEPILDLVHGSAEYYRVKPREGDAIIAEVSRVIADWRSVAQEVGIDRDEIETMADAFAP